MGKVKPYIYMISKDISKNTYASGTRWSCARNYDRLNGPAILECDKYGIVDTMIWYQYNLYGYRQNNRPSRIDLVSGSIEKLGWYREINAANIYYREDKGPVEIILYNNGEVYQITFLLIHIRCVSYNKLHHYSSIFTKFIKKNSEHASICFSQGGGIVINNTPYYA